MRKREAEAFRRQVLHVVERAESAPERILKEANETLAKLGTGDGAAISRIAFLRHRTELELLDLARTMRVLLDEYVPERR